MCSYTTDIEVNILVHMFRIRFEYCFQINSKKGQLSNFVPKDYLSRQYISFETEAIVISPSHNTVSRVYNDR